MEITEQTVSMLANKLADGQELSAQELDLAEVIYKRIDLEVLQVVYEVINRLGEMKKWNRLDEEFYSYIAEPIHEIINRVANSYSGWVKEVREENVKLRNTIDMLLETKES